MQGKSRAAEGIRRRPRGDGKTAYEAWVFIPVPGQKHGGTKLRKTFDSLKEAKDWRAAQIVGIGEGTVRGPSKLTVREAWREAGSVTRRGCSQKGAGDYKPSTLRGYKADMERYVLPFLGAYKMSALTVAHGQELVERLERQGLSGSRTRFGTCSFPCGCRSTRTASP